MDSSLPRTRAEAKALGAARYSTGKACPHGHTAARMTHSGGCEECKRARTREYMRQWAANNPEAKRKRAAEHYARNAERIKEKTKKYAQENADAVRERARQYAAAHREEARARAIAWRERNIEHKKRYDLRFREANRALVTAYKAFYRAARRQATPPWLTEDDREHIRAVYAAARKLTETTGERYDVDHIVPLQGKVVCGLHVPWNLRAIPRAQNNRRPRIYREDAE